MPSISRTDIGRRVVVRFRLSSPVDGAHATDVIGTLRSWGDGVLSVEARDGELVAVAERDIIAAKVVPPRTVTRREVRDLEAAAALGWQALETAELRGWLLRAAHGFTGRANSCLPLGDPGRPLAAAIDEVERWYGARSLTPAFQVPRPLGAVLDAELDLRGWALPPEDVIVMTAPAGPLAERVRPESPPVAIDDKPDDAWLAAYHYRGGTLPPHALVVLVNAKSVGFASIDVGNRRAAIARGAVSAAPSGRRWLGLTAIEVDPGHRRRGLGTQVVAALAAWARGHQATHAYLQVSADNVDAIRTYERLGFMEHHRYYYRRRS